MRVILVKGGYVALVDEEDYDRFKDLKWSQGSGGYATASKHKPGGGQIKIKMHRAVMNAGFGDIVDHINGNKLDNRRCNLRFASMRLNAQNHLLYKTNRSGHTGVYWHIVTKRWRAAIYADKKHHYLGEYDKKEDALKARKEGELKYWGHKIEA